MTTDTAKYAIQYLDPEYRTERETVYLTHASAVSAAEELSQEGTTVLKIVRR